MKRRRKNNSNNKIIILLIILVIIIAVTPFASSLGKYVYNAVHDYYLGTKGFYFYSDKLSSNGTEFELANNWSGAESYEMVIGLNSKRNDLVFAEPDITYTVEYTHSDNISCTISKTSGTIVGSNNSGSNEDYFVITIQPANGTGLANGTDTWVNVKVTSTSPYTSVLTGKLHVGVGSADISYGIIDSVNSPYLEVNITNSLNENKDVTLSFNPEILLLDMTSDFSIYSNSETTTNESRTESVNRNDNTGVDSVTNTYKYVNTVTSNVGSLETKTVKFYKVDTSQNYSWQNGDTEQPKVTLSYTK